jgi:hypothetical protein
MVEKYIVVKNILTKEELDLLKSYSRIKHKINFDSFDFNQSGNFDTMFYGDPVMEALMLQKQKILETKTNLELLPTYAFWRMYTSFADLKKHKDRPSCEISVTIQLGSDGTPWPIYMEDKSILLEDGDGVIYKGCEIEHSREEFQGDWHSQVFLHYVDKNGKNIEWVKDKRPYWGLPKYGN